MTLINSAISKILDKSGISAFGLSMPVLSPSWTRTNLPDVKEDKLALELSSDVWLAPISGIRRNIRDSSLPVTLVRADGTNAAGPGSLITLLPQVYLRLSRLHSKILEGRDATDTDPGFPMRQVPRYFFFSGIVDSSAPSGDVSAGSEVGTFAELTIYDDSGMPVDPLAVASAFYALMSNQHILQQRSSGTAFNENPQIKDIAGLNKDSAIRVRLSDHQGKPYDGAHLSGIDEVAKASGLFKLKVGSGSSSAQSITKEAGTGATGSFPDEERRLVLLGPSTTGRLGENFEHKSLVEGVSLMRDFFSVRVIQLKQYLLGSPHTEFIGTKVERQPTVRIHEPLGFLTDGNDVLAAANAAIANALQAPANNRESLSVAQTMTAGFAVAGAVGEQAHWPAFPAKASTSEPEEPLSIDLRKEFTVTAAFRDAPDPLNVDVVLTLAGLPKDNVRPCIPSQVHRGCA